MGAHRVGLLGDGHLRPRAGSRASQLLGSAPIVIVIGLTGGIASGKSTVARMLAERGARVLDADRLGHRAYEPGTAAHRELIARFGEGVRAEDGSIDRKALGKRVFEDPAELERLTAIVWPEIRRLAREEIERVRAEDENAILVLEAAVLLEAGWEDLVDEVWVVVTPPETAVERAVARGGLDADAVRARLASQLGNEERKARADLAIENDGDLAELRARVEAAWSALQGRRGAPREGA